MPSIKKERKSVYNNNINFKSGMPCLCDFQTSRFIMKLNGNVTVLNQHSTALTTTIPEIVEKKDPLLLMVL